MSMHWFVYPLCQSPGRVLFGVFLRGVLPTPAEFRIFSDSTVPVNITISPFSVQNNLKGAD